MINQTLKIILAGDATEEDGEVLKSMIQNLVRKSGFYV